MNIPENKSKLFTSNFWKNNNLDYILLTENVSRQWLTNFQTSSGFILLSKHWMKPKLFLDARYFTEAQVKVKNCDLEKLENFTVFLRKLNGKVGFEDAVTHLFFQKLAKINKNIDLTPFSLANLRMIKSDSEISHLRKICHLTKQIWQKVVLFVQEPKTEKEVERFIINQFLQNEVNELSFLPIVSSDKRSAFIHTSATKELIKENLLCDFGGKWNGYCSDFTRTLILNPQSKLNSYFQIVEKVHKKVISHIKPGVKVSELALIADEIYLENNLELKHALGHGIGLEVHEKLIISQQNDLVLQPGMVFTIEPGIYLSNLGGIRIEDVILVTKTGYEILTN